MNAAAGATTVEPAPLIVPPDQVIALETVATPPPFNAPPDRLKVFTPRGPLAVSVPLDRFKVLLTAELGVPSVSVPPLTVSVSSLCNCAAFCAPMLTVIVWLPGTLISTACPLVGTPSVQFAPSDQSPLVPIH